MHPILARKELAGPGGDLGRYESSYVGGGTAAFDVGVALRLPSSPPLQAAPTLPSLRLPSPAPPSSSALSY
ncbi:hypothetical protein AAFF_G00125700 [Aldrovandia affinis]|uniref:Uncharacterized protein n=1 Tax=Aldrovandia affinis TaxID=143900 RepID=A0AAD7R0T7_9TELE|nr:hypothetical protein AAFF_G00125700 [Aldrovandia affinis]